MGNKAKAARKIKRDAAKRAAKEKKRALYKIYSEQGRKNLTKRHRKTGGKGKHQHLEPNCGNPGCLRCHPETSDYVLPNGYTRSVWKAKMKDWGGKMPAKWIQKLEEVGRLRAAS